MRRLPLTLAAAGALAVVVLVASASCNGSEAPTSLPGGPAPPQNAVLAWKEPTPASGPALTFRVQSLTVTAKGWSAKVGIDNGTAVTWKLDGGEEKGGLLPGRSFGVMVFPTGSLEDAQSANEKGSLPPVRRAERIAPALPAELTPGASWDGTISARGNLPAGLWVRLAFGPLWTLETPPEGLEAALVWFTDHATQLKG